MSEIDPHYAQDAKRKDAAAAYLAVAQKFPQHAVAPRAQYLASFTLLGLGDTACATAIEGDHNSVLTLDPASGATKVLLSGPVSMASGEGKVSLSASAFDITQYNARAQQSDGTYQATGTVEVKGLRLGAAGELNKHWTIGTKVHGGAMVALCANAARTACGGAGQQPVAVSANFLSAPDPGRMRLVTS